MTTSNVLFLALLVAGAPAPAETFFLDDFDSASHNLTANGSLPAEGGEWKGTPPNGFVAVNPKGSAGMLAFNLETKRGAWLGASLTKAPQPDQDLTLRAIVENPVNASPESYWIGLGLDRDPAARMGNETPLWLQIWSTKSATATNITLRLNGKILAEIENPAGIPEWNSEGPNEIALNYAAKTLSVTLNEKTIVPETPATLPAHLDHIKIGVSGNYDGPRRGIRLDRIAIETP